MVVCMEDPPLRPFFGTTVDALCEAPLRRCALAPLALPAAAGGPAAVATPCWHCAPTAPRLPPRLPQSGVRRFHRRCGTACRMGTTSCTPRWAPFPALLSRAGLLLLQEVLLPPLPRGTPRWVVSCACRVTMQARGQHQLHSAAAVLGSCGAGPCCAQSLCPSSPARHKPNGAEHTQHRHAHPGAQAVWVSLRPNLY